MNYENYLKTELIILIPVLYCIGIGLKKSKLSDRWIPLLLGTISVLLSAVWVISTSSFANINEIAAAIFMAVTQGVLAAGASVYVNQIYLQSRKDE